MPLVISIASGRDAPLGRQRLPAGARAGHVQVAPRAAATRASVGHVFRGTHTRGLARLPKHVRAGSTLQRRDSQGQTSCAQAMAEAPDDHHIPGCAARPACAACLELPEAALHARARRTQHASPCAPCEQVYTQERPQHISHSQRCRRGVVRARPPCASPRRRPSRARARSASCARARRGARAGRASRPSRPTPSRRCARPRRRPR